MAVESDQSAQDASRAAEATEALLGALLFDFPLAWPQVKDVVNSTHFLRIDHRMIFGAVTALVAAGSPVDGVLVAAELGDQLEAAGGRGYLGTLIASVPSAANAGAYARIVRDYANRQKVVDLGQQTAARARLGTSAADAVEDLRRKLAGIDLGQAAEPLDLTPVSAWADDPPRAREWVLEGLIPAGKVTSLIGNGGLGKTLVALQIGLHVSLGRSLYGLAVSGGPVLGVFCEDDQDEIKRRVWDACAAENIDRAAADRFVPISREGLDSYLCTFENERMRVEPFYRQLEATIALLSPRLVILDTAADLFVGDFISTAQVRQFLKVALGGLCVRYGCAVLLLAHPSKAGQQSGEGDGFSTAWHNSVRSRLFLRAQVAPTEVGADPPAEDDKSARRMLELKKSNYGKSGTKIPLLYQSGAFALDPDPIEVPPESVRVKTASIAVGALEIIRKRDPLVTAFRELFDQLQDAGTIPDGSYDDRRKPLQRALRQLVKEGLIVETTTPRGYRAHA